MAEYKIFAGKTLIGHSALESGDPPMGVVFGRFLPLPAYADFQPQCIDCRDVSQEHLRLSITCPNGEMLPADGGVAILDYSAEAGDDGIEIHAFGVGYPAYARLFPSLVAAYGGHAA